MGIRVGFTGTQTGMTKQQRDAVRGILESVDAEEFHHGDCIGADAQAHGIAKGMKIHICIHPPTNESKRAYCEGAGEIRAPRPFLDRNKDIVIWSDVLIATPKGPEELRSGTWSTVRYARKQNRKIYIVNPDGSIV